MKITNIQIGAMVAILLMGYFIFGQGLYSLYGACEPKEQAGFALVPYYTLYKCEPTSHAETFNSLQLPAKDNINDPSTLITCGDDEFTKDTCGDIAVYCQDSNYVILQADGLTDYPIGGTEWAKAPVTPNTFQVIIGGLSIGERVKIRGCGNIGFFSTVTYTSGTVKSYYLPYGLYLYDSGSQKLISSTNCNVPSTIEQCKDCVVPNLGLGLSSGTTTIINNPRTDLLPDTFSTSIKQWLVTPIKSGTFTDIDGSRVFCTDHVIYSSDTISTEMGCALIPMKDKRQVDCCPGEKLNQYTFCGSDFKWKYGDAGCIVGGIKTIAACNGGGAWYTSTSRTYQKATACNTDGTCSYTTLTAPCAPPNIGCPTGASCQVDTNNPANNKCVGGLVPCGDADKDCIDDCTRAPISGCTVEDDDDDKVETLCETDLECKDNDMFTIDRCEGLKIAGIDTGMNKKCTHTDASVWYIIGGGIVLIFIMIIIILILQNKPKAGKKKK